ncbi:MAG: hypothetical protein KJO31_04535, partial [Gammaproteobacteria bacterium]|nr:hypothetical protein [Gammaproteobacteria bacterium]
VLDDAGLPRPWDVEFGFVDGALTLFQIRPLVERGSGTADDLMRKRRPKAINVVTGEERLSLDERPRSGRQ